MKTNDVNADIQHGRRWTRRTAEWFADAARESDFPAKVLKVVRPYLNARATVLDIGAGAGVFSVPIAAKVRRVTAVEPSAHMGSQLEAAARDAGVRAKIRCVRSRWEDARVGPHDLILCINIPSSLVDNPDFIRNVDTLARRAVFVVQSVESIQNKFFYDELYPLLLRKPYPSKGDYLDTYRVIHDCGIYPDVKIIDYHFHQKFAGMDEALLFWEEHMNLPKGKHRGKLEPFLESRLKPLPGGGLIHFIQKRSAVISWEKDKR